MELAIAQLRWGWRHFFKVWDLVGNQMGLLTRLTTLINWTIQDKVNSMCHFAHGGPISIRLWSHPPPPPPPPSLSFPTSGSFSSESVFHIRWPKDWWASILAMNIQGWFPLGLTLWFPCCPRDSQESPPAPQFEKHQFFSAQPSLWSNSHIHTWLLEKP